MLDFQTRFEDDTMYVTDVNRKLKQPSRAKDAVYVPASGLRQYDADTWAPYTQV